MNWLLLTFAALLFRAVYGVMTKVLSSGIKASAYTQAFLFVLAGGVVTLMASPIFGEIKLIFESVDMLALVLLICSSGVGNVVYFAAIRHLSNGTAQIAFSSILVFNTLFSVTVFNTQLTGMNWAGILVLGAAIVMAVTGKLEYQRRGLWLMILAGGLFSIFQLSSSVLSSQINSATYMLLAYGSNMVMVLLYFHKTILAEIRLIKNKTLLFTIPVLTTLPNIGYLALSYTAYRLAPEPTKVAMLLPGQVVATIILSYLVLNEKDHVVRKAIAAVMVVVSGWLIKS